MAFEDDFMFNKAINEDIVPMQRVSRSKAHAEAKLIAKVHKDLGFDELNLEYKFGVVRIGPFGL